MFIHNIWELQSVLSTPCSTGFAALQVPGLKNEIWFQEGSAGKGCCALEERSVGSGENQGGAGDGMGQSCVPLWQPSLPKGFPGRFGVGVGAGGDCRGCNCCARSREGCAASLPAELQLIPAPKLSRAAAFPAGNHPFLHLGRFFFMLEKEIFFFFNQNRFFCVALHASLFLFATSFPFCSHLFPHPFLLLS